MAPSQPPFADGFVSQSRRVQIYNLVPDLFWQICGLANVAIEIGMEETDF